MDKLDPVPTLPTSDAQVLETALVLNIALHRTFVPHILERIIDFAEYWPALGFDGTEDNLLSSGPRFIVGVLPPQPGTCAVKLHLRFRFIGQESAEGDGHPKQTPERCLTRSIRETEDPALRNRYTIYFSRLNPTKRWNNGFYRGCRLYYKLTLAQADPAHNGHFQARKGVWFDGVFYEESDADAFEVPLIQNTRALVFRGLLEDLCPCDELEMVFSSQYVDGMKVQVDARLYVKPHVDFERLVIRGGFGCPRSLRKRRFRKENA